MNDSVSLGDKDLFILSVSFMTNRSASWRNSRDLFHRLSSVAPTFILYLSPSNSTVILSNPTEDFKSSFIMYKILQVLSIHWYLVFAFFYLIRVIFSINSLGLVWSVSAWFLCHLYMTCLNQIRLKSGIRSFFTVGVAPAPAAAVSAPNAPPCSAYNL